MLESSFQYKPLRPLLGDPDIRYWRNKIEQNIKENGTRDKYRNKSCEIVEDLTKLNLLCKILKSEKKSSRRKGESANSEQVKTFDERLSRDHDRILTSQHTNASTPLSRKSESRVKDMHLVTFRPGADWSDKPNRRKHFPREIFTNKKLF